jgi:oxalate decarboxylase/phosphoglucose isomerase-like protein (cupin superfamily)
LPWRRPHRRHGALGHYVENVGDTDLQFIGVFGVSSYQEISLSNGLTHMPPALVAQHLNIDEATIAKWPDGGRPRYHAQSVRSRKTRARIAGG